MFVARLGRMSLHTLRGATTAALLSVAPALAGTGFSGPLDGMRFSVGIVRTDKGTTAPEPLGDVLSFSEGAFSSAICERFNFVPGAYWTRRQGDVVHFYSELESPTDGRMIWNGQIRNGHLDGTMRWIRKRWYWTIDATHRITGDLKEQTGRAGADAD